MLNAENMKTARVEILNKGDFISALADLFSVFLTQYPYSYASAISYVQLPCQLMPHICQVHVQS